jgi:hypothetical protein
LLLNAAGEKHAALDIGSSQPKMLLRDTGMDVAINEPLHPWIKVDDVCE